MQAIIAARPQARLDPKILRGQIDSVKPFFVTKASEGKPIGWMMEEDWAAAVKTLSSAQLIKSGAAAEFFTNTLLDQRMDRIAEAENITVSNEEVEAEIEAAARQSRQPVEQLRAALTKHGGERSIAQRLRNRKALELLVENARITDAEWNESNEANAATT